MRKCASLCNRSGFLVLSDDDVRRCDGINNRLRELEAILHARAMTLDAELSRRVADLDDWLDDYEIDAVFDFVLCNKDPAFRDDSDNILLRTVLQLKVVRGCEREYEYGFGALRVHHGELGYDVTDQPHCWTYHDLYNHQGLYWFEIVRIGTILAELQVWEQTCRSID